MAYVKSSKIKMFPSSWRRKEYNPEANLNTEENLTNISRRVSAQSYDSYVISKDGNEITFVIHGYWFKADLSDVIVDESPLFAKIKLVNSIPDGNTDFNNLTLVPTAASVPGQLDDNLEIPENPDNDTNEFHGVEFYTSAIPTPWPENVFELQLLNEEGNVPPKSYLNISTEQIQNGPGSSSPINSEFTTVKENVSLLNIWNKIVPGTNISSATIGASSTPFKSAYFSTVYAERANATTVFGDFASFSAAGITSLYTTYIEPFSANGITVVGSDYFNIGSTNSFYADTNYISLYATNSIALSANTANGRIDISASNLSLNCHYNMKLYGGNSVDVDTPSLNVGRITSANASGTIFLGSQAILAYASYPAYIGKLNTLSIKNLATNGEIEITASSTITLDAPYLSITAVSGPGVELYTENFMANAYSVNLLAKASRTRLTSDSVGNSSSPIYLNNGVPTSCSDIASGSGGGEIPSDLHLPAELPLWQSTGKAPTSFNQITTLNIPGNFSWSWIRVGKVIKFSIDLSFTGTLTEDRWYGVQIGQLLGAAGITGSPNYKKCSCVGSLKRLGLDGLGAVGVTTIKELTNSSLTYAYALVGVDEKGDYPVQGFSMEVTVVLD